ncbi:hypothetical protein Ciccas_007907 [Cichlidogyrus casuarinus]|uniref:Uncharacterized protein n=1 Tax=Cichlidogyrus casuarinus TaxID=1844966 RepID=A0ABD2Q1L0_9PLAT
MIDRQQNNGTECFQISAGGSISQLTSTTSNLPMMDLYQQPANSANANYVLQPSETLVELGYNNTPWNNTGNGAVQFANGSDMHQQPGGFYQGANPSQFLNLQSPAATPQHMLVSSSAALTILHNQQSNGSLDSASNSTPGSSLTDSPLSLVQSNAGLQIKLSPSGSQHRSNPSTPSKTPSSTGKSQRQRKITKSERCAAHFGAAHRTELLQMRWHASAKCYGTEQLSRVALNLPVTPDNPCSTFALLSRIKQATRICAINHMKN